MPSTFVNGNKVAYAYETIGTMTAATGLTAANLTQVPTTIGQFDAQRKCDEVYISVEDADVRVTFDGTTPTVSAGTAAGHLYGHGDTLVISGFEAISKFRCINAVAANGAKIRASFFRR